MPAAPQGKKAAATPTAHDEERELAEMRAAGFMGTPARGGGAGGGGGGRESTPGEQGGMC